MPTFDARFARMAGRAEALQIAQIEAQLGRIPHRLDVIDLEPPARPALDAGPAIAPQRLEP